MDYKKDIQKADTIGRFIDTQSAHVDPFGENKSGARAYRRAERIVAAIHLLTNHIPTDEPLRVSLRKQGIQLLSEILSLRDEMRSQGSYKLSQLESTLLEVTSLLKLMGISGFISFPNATVLTDALDDLSNFLHLSSRSNLSESLHLSRDEFIEGHGTVSFIRDIKDKRNIKDSSVVKDREGNASDVLYKTNVAYSRGERVTAVLKSHGEMGIRDIVENLPEYSEKMIQRTLVDMVAAGRVKRIGLKRWSRYVLVDTKLP